MPAAASREKKATERFSDCGVVECDGDAMGLCPTSVALFLAGVQPGDTESVSGPTGMRETGGADALKKFRRLRKFAD
jgi:hypothetical protein